MKLTALEVQIERIAARHLGFATLETRGSDRLDFKDVNCERLKQALVEAYQLGLDNRDETD